MTSLQEQLKRLTVPHVQHSLEGKKSSLLFDSRDVQAVDREVLYEVASTALKELKSINSSLKKYEDLLFHKNQLSVDRTLHDKKFNKKLNKVIKQYLIELSPYFMMRNAQKTLEWLIHHYKIELFNIDDLIMTFLPFHQTNIFVRLLMMLDLEKPSYKWHWLNECAKNGIPLPKSLVLNHCKKDSSFLQQVFSMVDVYVEVIGANNSNLSLVVDHCNVIGLLLMEKQNEIHEEIVSTLMQYVMKGLKSKSPLREAGCYPIIATLAARVSLKEDKVLQLATIICKYVSDDFFNTALHCLSVVVSKQQNHVQFSVEIFKHLKLHELQIYEVEEFSKKYPSSPLLKMLGSADESGVIKKLVEKLKKEDVCDLAHVGVVNSIDISNVDSTILLKKLFKQLETQDIDQYSVFISDFLSDTSPNDKDISVIKVIITKLSNLILNLDEKLFEAKIQDLLRIDNNFHKHTLKYTYLCVLLLSDLLTKQFKAKKSEKVCIIITCNALSSQIVKGVYSSCTRRVFKDKAVSDLFSIDFKDALNIEQFFYTHLLALADYLKQFNKQLNDFYSQNKVISNLCREVFYAVKNIAIKKDVTNTVLNCFDGNNVVKGYCQYVCNITKGASVHNIDNNKLKEFIINSRNWFIKKIKTDDVHIEDDVLITLILLLANEDNNVREFIMTVLETYLVKDSAEEGSFKPLIKKLLVFKDEIRSDYTVLNQVLSSKFSSDTELSSGMKKAFDVILNILDSDDFDLKYRLLNNLQTCKTQEFNLKVLEIASCSLNNLLEGGKEVENIRIFNVCLKCLSKTKKKFLKNGGFFKLTMQVLNADFTKVKKVDITRVITCVLENLQDASFQTFSEENKKEMTTKMVDMAVNKKWNVTKVISECLRELKISADIIKSMFDFRHEEETEPSKKKARVEIEINLPKFKFVLEFLHSSSNMDKSKDLCSLLGKALTYLYSKDDTDYECQLVLTCLHKIITSLDDLEAKSYEKYLNIEALVQCLRRTNNFQTQQHIVLVMTAISPFFPDQLLNNIISIFAFMGDNFVQKDDSYSFQILTRLINVALSAVVKLPLDNPKKESSTINILRVFVDSRKHIPQHRLIPLFTQLLSIGVDEYLWKLIILIVESISMHKEEYKQKMPFEYGIITTLFSKYPLQTQLLALNSLIRFLINYLEALDVNSKTDIEVVGPLVSTSTDTRFITLHLNKVIYNILSDNGFSRSFLKMLETGEEEIKGEVFQSLINSLVQYILSINKKQKKITHEMFWPALLKLVNLNLKRVNYLLPSFVFVDVLDCLLSQSIMTVKTKGLELMYAKLDLIDQNEFKPSEYASIVKLTPLLLSNLQTTHVEKPQENNPIFYIQQLSFLNLKILCKCYGPENKEMFSELPQLILKFLENKSNNIAVIDSALFCLLEVVVLMKSKVVPHLNNMMVALTGLFEKKEMLEKTISLDCLLSVFSKIISHLGQFLSPFLDQLISQLCCLSEDKVIQDKLNEKLIVIAKTVETRLLIPCLIKTYHSMSTPNGYNALLTLLKTHLEFAGKDQLVGSSRTMTDFLCVLMNLRNDAASLSCEEMDALEELYTQSTIAFIVHLSEVSFRPLLEKLYNSMADDISKTLTFFNLMCAFSTKLKGIFNLFSGFLIKLIVKLLNLHNDSVKQDDSDKGLVVNANEDESCLLMEHILRLVTMCYNCDVDGAFALATGDSLFVAIVDQLENLKGKYEERMDTRMIPCLVQICQSIKENDQLIALNKLICYKSKHKDWRVRMAAVKCLKAMVQSLGNLYEMLFPETASYLSELLEDDKEEVAHESRLFRSCLEKVIGSLDNFF